MSESQDRSCIGAYIHDIKQILNRSRSVMFKFTPRSTNSLAHIVATESLKMKEELYMEITVPEYAEKQQQIDWRKEPD